MVTKEAENRVSISIQNLPEFDADGTPLAYDIIPANRDGKISGAIYSGYEVRITHVTEFFRFPGGMEELPRTGFSSRLPYSLADKPLSINYAQTGLVLQIPSLDVIADIVQVPFLENEYPVQWLGDAAGLLQGSARPGEGVSILTGHNHLSSIEAGPFAFLSQLEPGTKLFVMKKNNESISFTVICNELITAEDMAALETIANQSENTLTLLTCENELSGGGYANRRVIAAIPD
ncbi:MAG: class F sortase [Flexilinea sp.]|nr:class F sortase [Flexilinea sp.]